MDCLTNKAEAATVLCAMTGRDWRKERTVFYLDEDRNEAFPVVMEAMLRLCTQSVTKLGQLVLKREDIVQRLNQCCDRDRDGYYLDGFVDVAVTDYVNALQSRRDEGKTPVRNPVNYACYALWSATDTYQRMKWLEQQENVLFY
jgi:hypothetical protein